MVQPSDIKAATRIISQMIAAKAALYTQELCQKEPDHAYLLQLNEQIIEFGRERHACHNPDKQETFVNRAFHTYQPLLDIDPKYKF